MKREGKRGREKGRKEKRGKSKKGKKGEARERRLSLEHIIQVIDWDQEEERQTSLRDHTNGHISNLLLGRHLSSRFKTELP